MHVCGFLFANECLNEKPFPGKPFGRCGESAADNASETGYFCDFIQLYEKTEPNAGIFASGTESLERLGAHVESFGEDALTSIELHVDLVALGDYGAAPPPGRAPGRSPRRPGRLPSASSGLAPAPPGACRAPASAPAGGGTSPLSSHWAPKGRKTPSGGRRAAARPSRRSRPGGCSPDGRPAPPATERTRAPPDSAAPNAASEACGRPSSSAGGSPRAGARRSPPAPTG